MSNKLYSLVGFSCSIMSLLTILGFVALATCETPLEKSLRSIETDIATMQAQTEFINAKCEELRIIRDDVRTFLADF